MATKYDPRAMMRWHHQLIKEKVRAQGIRETARRCGLNPMRVSRFCSGHASGVSAFDFYIIAHAVGYAPELR